MRTRSDPTRKLTRDLAAYRAERRRWPALATLPDGTRLRRQFRGQWHEAVVVPGGYASEGQLFATLHDVMLAWVGPAGVVRVPRSTALGYRDVCMFSTRRFFAESVLDAIAL